VEVSAPFYADDALMKIADCLAFMKNEITQTDLQSIALEDRLD
jgi:hypothetical protein